MSRNSPVSLEAHDNFRDPPAELAREGARRMLALEAEVGELLARCDGVERPDGRKAAVRSGYRPRREILHRRRAGLGADTQDPLLHRRAGRVPVRAGSAAGAQAMAFT